MGGAEYRNTAENIDKYRNTAKNIGKYRNTASKVDEIPKSQKRGITFSQDNAPQIHFSRKRKQTTPFLRSISMGTTGSQCRSKGNISGGGGGGGTRAPEDFEI